MNKRDDEYEFLKRELRFESEYRKNQPGFVDRALGYATIVCGLAILVIVGLAYFKVI